MFIMESNPTISGGEDAAGERCGSFDVLELAGRTLCTDCLALAGCGCAGHGGGHEE
jgi:hypothetical protein